MLVREIEKGNEEMNRMKCELRNLRVGDFCEEESMSMKEEEASEISEIIERERR